MLPEDLWNRVPRKHTQVIRAHDGGERTRCTYRKDSCGILPSQCFPSTPSHARWPSSRSGRAISDSLARTAGSRKRAGASFLNPRAPCETP